MISQLGEAVANRMPPRQLLRAMRPHPSFEEALGDALGDLCNKLEKS
jgi:dihydrolipoamide dehydrogenase